MWPVPDSSDYRGLNSEELVVNTSTDFFTSSERRLIEQIGRTPSAASSAAERRYSIQQRHDEALRYSKTAHRSDDRRKPVWKTERHPTNTQTARRYALIAELRRRGPQSDRLEANEVEPARDRFQDGRDHDFMSRWPLLHDLIAHDQAALVCYILISLTLLLAELTPVLTKLFAPVSAYDLALERQMCEAKTDLEAAERSYPAIASIRACQQLLVHRVEFERELRARLIAELQERFAIIQEIRTQIPRRASQIQQDSLRQVLDALMLRLSESTEELLPLVKPTPIPE